MSQLKNLQQFIERQDIKTDPYWKSILLSDTRNIFPKYQLSKIEIAKNKVAKLRLVMEQLPTFLSLQIYAKSIDNVIKTTPQKEIRKELDDLQKDIESCKTDNQSNDYDFQILELKGKVEALCSQLSKNKIQPQLKQTLQKSKKWKAYLDSNFKTPQQFDSILNERDKANLAFNINLKDVDDSLMGGTSGKIIEERAKDEIFKHRLRQIFASESLQLEFPQQGDQFSREWKQIEDKLKDRNDQM